MPRLFSNRKAGGAGQRIPLSMFKESIVVLRTSSIPSSTDTSWIRKAKKVCQAMAAYEGGVINMRRGEKHSSKELHLFVIPKDELYVFNATDFVIHGDQAFEVVSYEDIYLGNRTYCQINTLPFGKVNDANFEVIADSETNASAFSMEGIVFTFGDIVFAIANHMPASVEEPDTHNLFWDTADSV